MPDRLSSRSWPLVGRAEELERLSRVRRAGDVLGVVLSGAAGVGKSRLAREALAAAAERRRAHGMGAGDAQRRGGADGRAGRAARGGFAL